MTPKNINDPLMIFRIQRHIKMKIKELMESLSKLDQNLEIYGYTEDVQMTAKVRPFQIFYINGIDVSVAERFRDENHEPTIIFGQSENSRSMALINLTTDF